MTDVGVHHKSAVITLVERLSKVIINLKPEGRTAGDIEIAINAWCHQIHRNVFKSITFDCGKEFSNCQSMSNRNDVDIYFADPARRPNGGERAFQWTASERQAAQAYGLQHGESEFCRFSGFQTKPHTQKVSGIPDTVGSIYELHGCRESV